MSDPHAYKFAVPFNCFKNCLLNYFKQQTVLDVFALQIKKLCIEFEFQQVLHMQNLVVEYFVTVR